MKQAWQLMAERLGGNLPLLLLTGLSLVVLALAGYLLSRWLGRLAVWLRARRWWRRLRPHMHHGEVQAAFAGYVSPACERRPGKIVDFRDFFRQTLFDQDPSTPGRILLLGPYGSGRTTALIRLCTMLPRRQTMLRSLPRLRDLDALRQPPPGCRILLLDGLDEVAGIGETLPVYLEALLVATQAYDKVVIAASHELFPDRDPRRLGYWSFTGDASYHTFQVLSLAPWPAALLRRRAARRDRKVLQMALETLPGFFSRPGWQRVLPAMHRQVLPYTFALIEADMQTALGRTQHPQGWLRLLDEAALYLYREYPQTGAWQLPRAAVDTWANSMGVKLREWAGGLLRPEPGRSVALYPHVAAYLVARRAYEEAWPEEELRFDGLIRRCYLEICWETFVRSVGQVEVRKPGQAGRLPAGSVSYEAIDQITYLYVRQAMPPDWRLLRYLHRLRGVFLQVPGIQYPPLGLVGMLAHPGVLLYLGNPDEGWLAWQLATSEATWDTGAGHAPGLARALRQHDPLEGVSLWRGWQPVQPAGAVWERLMRILGPDILHSDARLWEAGSSAEIGAPLDVQVLRFLPGSQVLTLFQRVRATRLHNGVCHLHLDNTHRPTLLIDELRGLVQRLHAVLGNDEAGRGLFDAEDLRAVEDGYWTGRRWSQTPAGVPVLLYMVRPWRIKLWVLGLGDDFLP
ncbi:MAG: hypothetical protein OHK0039_07660 [Bacteroidia bacterium]